MIYLAHNAKELNSIYLIHSKLLRLHVPRQKKVHPAVKHIKGLNTNANIIYDKANRAAGAKGDTARHNKPFYGKQNTSSGASITEAQRAASLCVATWQSAKVFDKGGATMSCPSEPTLYPSVFPPFRHNAEAACTLWRASTVHRFFRLFLYRHCCDTLSSFSLQHL